MIQFTEQKLNEIKEIISHYPEGKHKSVLLPVLHMAQDTFMFAFGIMGNNFLYLI